MRRGGPVAGFDAGRCTVLIEFGIGQCALVVDKLTAMTKEGETNSEGARRLANVGHVLAGEPSLSDQVVPCAVPWAVD